MGNWSGVSPSIQGPTWAYVRTVRGVVHRALFTPPIHFFLQASGLVELRMNGGAAASPGDLARGPLESLLIHLVTRLVVGRRHGVRRHGGMRTSRARASQHAPEWTGGSTCPGRTGSGRAGNFLMHPIAPSGFEHHRALAGQGPAPQISQARRNERKSGSAGSGAATGIQKVLSRLLIGGPLAGPRRAISTASPARSLPARAPSNCTPHETPPPRRCSPSSSSTTRRATPERKPPISRGTAPPDAPEQKAPASARTPALP